MSFFTELKRRQVFRVGVSYAAVSWLLIEVSVTIFPMFSLPDWGPTAVLIALVAGFPFVLIFAWIYQITPEGVMRDTGPGSVGDGPDTDRAVQDVVARRPVAHQSIAVLPFVNMSEDAGNDYFSDGLSEELLNLLARIPELHVAARTSSFSFKDEKVDIPTVAAKLNVAHVLEGSVRRIGDRVRITAQLVEADGGYHLWSESFDRTLDDIFRIQDEIAESVVAALKIRLLNATPRTRETSPETYALYLQGMHFQRLSNQESFAKAEAAYRQALALDPDYAPAWAALARNYWYEISGGIRSLESGVKLAFEACDRALSIDENLSAAHTTQALLATHYEFDWQTAESALDKARQLIPGSAEIALYTGALMKARGRFKEAVTQLEKSIALDPLNTTGHIWLAIALIPMGRLDEARGILQQVLNLYPGRTVAHGALSRICLLEGDVQAAHKEAQMEPEGFWRDYAMVFSLQAIGQRDEADNMFQKMKEHYLSDGPFQQAEMHVYRGEIDEAFLALDQAYTARDAGMVELLTSQFLTPLRGDARWQALLDRMGLSDPGPAILKAAATEGGP